jgi:hypothetical protein
MPDGNIPESMLQKIIDKRQEKYQLVWEMYLTLLVRDGYCEVSEAVYKVDKYLEWKEKNKNE